MADYGLSESAARHLENRQIAVLAGISRLYNLVFGKDLSELQLRQDSILRRISSLHKSVNGIPGDLRTYEFFDKTEAGVSAVQLSNGGVLNGDNGVHHKGLGEIKGDSGLSLHARSGDAVLDCCESHHGALSGFGTGGERLFAKENSVHSSDKGALRNFSGERWDEKQNGRIERNSSQANRESNTHGLRCNEFDCDSQGIETRLTAILRGAGASFLFKRMPSDYYMRSFEVRKDMLGAASVDHLCKSIVMVNTQAHESVKDCFDRNNSKYYVVVVQYTARLHAQKLRDFVWGLNNGKISKKSFKCMSCNFDTYVDIGIISMKGIVLSGINF